jgi:hypothetical protein
MEERRGGGEYRVARSAKGLFVGPTEVTILINVELKSVSVRSLLFDVAKKRVRWRAKTGDVWNQGSSCAAHQLPACVECNGVA